MATRTPQAQICRAAFIILLQLSTYSGQLFTISFQGVSDCGEESFFDISSLSCVKCGPNQVPNKSGLSCACQVGHRVLVSNGASVVCQRCPESKPAVTKDGYGCIRCPGAPGKDGTCTCPANHILVERDSWGNLQEEATCVPCNSSEPALSGPDSAGRRCVRCHDSFINTSLSCQCGSPNILAGGQCFSPSPLPTTVVASVNYAQLALPIQSVWFSSFLYSSAAACLLFSNRTSCQVLGNMCVMNMYSTSSASSNDACGLYNTIFRTTAAQGHTQDITHWRTNMPWLYYGDQPGLASRVLRSEPLPIGYSFRGPNQNTQIELIAAVYNAGGDFIRWENITKGSLQLCPDTVVRQEAAYTFGTAYKQSCVLPMSEVLARFPEPLFYDVFLVLRSFQGERRLVALPVLNLNLQFNGQFVNQGSNMNSWYLTRRLMIVDTLSGREKSLSATPRVVRMATDIRIGFQLVPLTQRGEVYPPLITVSYTDVLISDPLTQTISVAFSMDYEMDQNEARVKTDIALGVLGGVAVIYSLVKTASWKRRIMSPIIDLETILKFLLFYAGDLANVFFVIAVGTGLYWLIFYKAQQFVSVLLPLPEQEERFMTYVGCAFGLKAVQFLHKFLLQLSVDIFFIDWERPRSKALKPVDGGEGRSGSAPVSIWRTYFVANEWNEIQTLRKISPTFQVLCVLFLLEVVGFSRLALRDPWATLSRPPHAYTPAHSQVLRFGLASCLWLAVGLLQVLFFTVFHERFIEDKIRQFVDLCSISNVSVLVLSHRCFGYYIHGRSVHGHADTNMEEMNANLKREAENLCGQRGLLPNSDTQTFQIAITDRLRNQYDRILEPLSRRNGPTRLLDTSANPFEQSTKAYHTMNRFLSSIIDHAHREMDYIVRDKLLFERVIGMEFMEPIDKSIFYNDESHSFSDVLFYGNEATLLIFDTLFFCVVDLGSQSFILAAALTYLQQMIFRLIRDAIGRRNLAAKTLVDKRFLI